MRVPWVIGLMGQQLRYFWRQTSLAVLGISVGVLVLLVVLSFAHGLDAFFAKQMLALTPHLSLEAGINQLVTKDLQAEIDEVPGVVHSAPYLRFPALIQRGLAMESVVVKGVTWELENRLFKLEGLLEQGDWQDVLAQPGVLLGAELARLLAVGVGDLIQITAPRGTIHLPVQALFFSGFYENDVSLVFTSLEIAQTLWNVQGLTGYGVNVVDLVGVDDYILPLQQATDLWVRPWYQHQPSLFIGLQVQRQVIVFILFFVFLVAALGIANVFTLRLLAQQKSVGILRALGATPRNIWQLFVGQALICGVLGSMIGVGFAYLIVLYLGRYPMELPQVFYMQTLPISWASQDVWWVFGVALATSLIAILYPAYQFSRIQPTEVIRNG